MRSTAKQGARRRLRLGSGLGWLTWIGVALVGCSSPPPTPPPAPQSLDARLAYAAGKAAYHELRIREALEHLHLAVHLDRDLLEAQDLFVMASYLVGCIETPPPCAFPAFGGRPDVWAELEADLGAHVAASLRESERLKAAGLVREAEEFARCAQELAQLQPPLCPAQIPVRTQ